MAKRGVASSWLGSWPFKHVAADVGMKEENGEGEIDEKNRVCLAGHAARRRSNRSRGHRCRCEAKRKGSCRSTSRRHAACGRFVRKHCCPPRTEVRTACAQLSDTRNRTVLSSELLARAVLADVRRRKPGFPGVSIRGLRPKLSRSVQPSACCDQQLSPCVIRVTFVPQEA